MEIPHYPQSREMVLDDKPLLDTMFQRLQPRISEFTFAGLFLFRNAHAYRLARVGESLVILGKGYDGTEYFLPPLFGDVGDALTSLLEDAHVLYGADETFVHEHLQGRGGVEILEDRDSFDYLYLRRDLAELPGNRFHKKKNRVNYFSSRHSYEVEPFSKQHVDGSLQLLDEWCRVRESIESSSLLFEANASGEALRMAENLGLDGLVVLVEGVVKAFVLGETLNDTTSVCHFEKADPFLEGLYQLVDREFCRRCFTECTHVNREQDLGEPNLRVSKLSYHPVELIKKYKVRVR